MSKGLYSPGECKDNCGFGLIAHVEGKPRVSLISGSMVLHDEKNSLKSVIFIRGLLKKKSLFQTTYEPNVASKTQQAEKLIEGIIYKTKKGQNHKDIENIGDIKDMDFELAEVTGMAIDKPIIQNFGYSNWAGVHHADPIPQELALPSDIRFREDLINMKRDAVGKGKVAKGKVTQAQKEKKRKEKEKEDKAQQEKP